MVKNKKLLSILPAFLLLCSLFLAGTAQAHSVSGTTQQLPAAQSPSIAAIQTESSVSSFGGRSVTWSGVFFGLAEYCRNVGSSDLYYSARVTNNTQPVDLIFRNANNGQAVTPSRRFNPNTSTPPLTFTRTPVSFGLNICAKGMLTGYTVLAAIYG